MGMSSGEDKKIIKFFSFSYSFRNFKKCFGTFKQFLSFTVPLHVLQLDGGAGDVQVEHRVVLIRERGLLSGSSGSASRSEISHIFCNISLRTEKKEKNTKCKP